MPPPRKTPEEPPPLEEGELHAALLKGNPELEAARDGSLVPIETMSEWHLATEPWVFVVDADGLISASFEGILGPDEIQTAINAL